MFLFARSLYFFQEKIKSEMVQRNVSSLKNRKNRIYNIEYPFQI